MNPVLAESARPSFGQQLKSFLTAGPVEPTVRLWRYPVLLAVSCLIFFSLSGRLLGVFDLGIALTSAMRVLHGEVPYRDFYYNYGPAQMYVNAAFFKLFGTSVLSAGLTAVLGGGIMSTVVYVLVRSFCERWIAAVGFALSICLPGASILGALCLWSTWLILPIFERELTKRRALWAGVTLGILTLYRYDTGIGLALAHMLTIAIALVSRKRGRRPQISEAAVTLWPYALGAAAIVLPAAVAYLCVAPLHDLLYDVVIYNAKYYKVGRGLPFPRIHRANFEDAIVYAVPLLACLGIMIAGRRLWKQRQDSTSVSEWAGAIAAFVLVAIIMYAKATVRVSTGAMYLSTPPITLIAALLYQHRHEFGDITRRSTALIAAVVCISAGMSEYKQVTVEARQHQLVLRWLVSHKGQVPFPPFEGWCKESNAISRGFCYVLDPDHMQTVHYIEEHTSPADRLYVGLSHHDRILANDNITYFATQRLPAVKWTQFDPFLENRADIQAEMIAQLEKNRPPYIVLDSEFDAIWEPNGSAVHTGVFLLDDYIAAHYTTVKTFGELSVLKRD